MRASDRFHNSAQYPRARVHSHSHKAAISKMRELQRPRSKRLPTCLETCARPRYMRPVDNSTTCRRAAKPRLPSESSFSPSRSRFYYPTATLKRTHRSDVAATDPDHTARLWKSVMSYNTDTESSKGKRKAKSTTSTSASNSDQRWRQIPPTSKSSSLRTRREIAAKVTDADFMESVLEPYGIMIQNKGVNKDLYKHFRIQELPHDPKGRLDAYKETFTLDSWLEPDTERIQRE